MKKKFLMLALMSAMSLSLFACGKTTEQEDQDKKIDLDSVSSLYVPGEDEIVMDNAGMGHVEGVLVVFFTKEATDEEIIEVIESLDGELIGKDERLKEYQIRIEDANQETLEKKAEKLLEKPCVLDAKLDRIYSISKSMTKPNDPWIESGEFDILDWDEKNPSGNNWWLEATRVPSAWDYSEYFTTINVGIVDDGIDVDHEDLAGMNIKILNPDLCDDGGNHGTHVTGIMMAEGNNGVGISGVLSNVNGYFVDVYANEEQENNYVSMTDMLEGISDCCREVGPDEKIVINLSSGLRYLGFDLIQSYIASNSAQDAISTIALLKYYDYDNFIISQAAGNDAVDAYECNGFFASMDEENVSAFLESHPSYAEYMTTEDIMGCIMIVAAVEEPYGGEYSLTYFSNFGHTITVAAPGSNIYSTIIADGEYGSYEVMSGTSMASPLAASITALAWSVNQDLKPIEIKKLIVESATTPVYTTDEKDTATCYYMIDAKAAVEAVLNYSGIDAVISDDNGGDDDDDFWSSFWDSFWGDDDDDGSSDSNGNTTTHFENIPVYYEDGYAFDVSIDIENMLITDINDTYSYEIIAEPLICIDVDGTMQVACLKDDKLRIFGAADNYTAQKFSMTFTDGSVSTGVMTSKTDGSVCFAYDYGTEDNLYHAFDYGDECLYILGTNGFICADYEYDSEDDILYIYLTESQSYEDGAFN